MMQTYLTRKNFVISLIAIGVLIGIFIAFDNLVFRLKSTDPSLDRVATSSIEITYYFSQPVKSVGSVIFNGNDITSDAVVDDKTIKVQFGKVLSKNSTYTITLQDIESKWFNNKINSLKSNFTAKYVDFNKLSDSEKKAQIDASNSGQVDDKFINENVFPILKEHWQISATVIPSDRVTVLEVEFLDEIPDYDRGGVSQQLPNDLADKYRLEVLEEIKKRGGNPDDYKIIYKTNTYLYEKYSQSKGHTD